MMDLFTNRRTSRNGGIPKRCRLSFEIYEHRRLLAGEIFNGSFESPLLGEWVPTGGAIATIVDRNTVSDIPDGASAIRLSNRTQPWNGIQQDLKNRLTIDADYEFSAWVRLATPGIQTVEIQIQYQDNRGFLYPSVARAEVTDTAWTQLRGGFRVGVEGTLQTLDIRFVGPAAGVDYYVDHVTVTPYDWRAATDAGIDAHRRRDVRLQFVGAAGTPIQVTSVDVQQVEHAFRFGTVVHTAELGNPNYTDFVTDNFNQVTPQNAWKWRFTEQTQGNEVYSGQVVGSRTLAADGLRLFAANNGLAIRGHNVLWSSDAGLPDWVADGSGHPRLTSSQLYDAVMNRVEAIATRYASDTDQWDVVNELLVDNFLRRNLDSVSPSGDIIKDIFNAVARFDPDATLFTNEFNIVNTASGAVAYRAMLDSMIANGIPVGGIGIQGHFDEPLAISSKAIQIELDRLTSLGLPIVITEFDNKRANIAERTEDFEIFYRTMFSRDEVTGITMWGFWEGVDDPTGTLSQFDRGGHWQGPDAALVDSNWIVNSVGRMYQALLEEWTTSESSNVPSTTFDFRGYHGDYRVTATLADGRRVTVPFELSKGATTAPFQIDVVPRDFGDAPVPYPTTFADSGAQHRAIGPRLGNQRDAEDDGQPSTTADGDGGDDDGVMFGTLRASDTMAALNIDLQNAASARIDAWIDFDRNGVWDRGEQILDSATVSSGLQTLNFSMPQTVATGMTFARVRVSSTGNLEPTGMANDGEVEDYRVKILAATPQVTSVVINRGEIQRSAITSIGVVFDRLVDVSANAFAITNIGIPAGSASIPVTAMVVNSNPVGGVTVATISFGVGDSVITRSGTNTLADGNYRLVVRAASISPTDNGPAMAADYIFGADQADKFYRLYGDVDGDGDTDFMDFINGFWPALNKTSGQEGYLDHLNHDVDNDVDMTDFADAFLPNFGTSRNRS